MKTRSWPILGSCASLLLAGALQAENYSMQYYTIAGGGGASAGGTEIGGGAYALVGSIGQAAAGGALTGADDALQGGFWSLIEAVQTPGAPTLVVVPIDSRTVKVSWAANPVFNLQESASLDVAALWTTNRLEVTTVHGTNSVEIPTRPGSLFFRLK